MVLEEEQPNEPSLQEAVAVTESSDRLVVGKENGTYFIGKVIHPFDAQAEGELSLVVDEYIVVRKVFESPIVCCSNILKIWKKI